MKNKSKKRQIQIEDDPDPTDENFFVDDIDKFHADREKIFLDEESSVPAKRVDTEELFPIHSDDDIFSDEELQQHEEQLKNLEKRVLKKRIYDSDFSDEEEDISQTIPKWGKDKRSYYGTDEAKLDYASDEPEANALEEQEALAIQRRLAAGITDEDLCLDRLGEMIQQVESKDISDVIATDLTTLSKKEKKHLLKQESPELFELKSDFVDKLKEIEYLESVGKFKMDKSTNDYVILRLQLCKIYCVNVSFYFTLKAESKTAKQHPVMGRLVKYRQLFTELDAIKLDMANKLEDAERSGVLAEEIAEVMDDSDSSDDESETDSEFENRLKAVFDRAKMQDDSIMVDANDTFESEQTEVVEGYDDEKRPINYQIAKNKGLTVRRKKIQRNPRVKHREKYRKAKIKRRSTVKEVRKELKPYGGELSGIRAGVSRSVKLKA